MTRLILSVLLLSCFVAPYLVTPSGEPENRRGDAAGRTLAGAAGAAQALRGAPHGRNAAGTAYAAVVAAPRRLTGTATWCAPTPRYCHGWGGTAMLGAVRSFRYGDEPYTVQVTGFYGGKANAVLVTVVSYCACPRTAIDLSPHAFAQLAPLSVGRIRVVVDGIRSGPSPRAIPTAPATDLEGTE